MSVKRQNTLSLGNHHKRRKSGETPSYFQQTLQEAGLTLKAPPEKCQASSETVYIVRNLRNNLKAHEDYPRNINKFLADFKKACENIKIFEHYLFFNIVRLTSDTKIVQTKDSLIKILLNVTFLQEKLVDFIFDKAMNQLDKPEFGSWMKMILQSLSTLDTLECSEKVANKLIDLLDISSDKFVRLEIILAIPDIIGDKEHNNVADQMSRILSDEPYLIPAILDCLSYLCLSDEQYHHLQKKTLEIIQPSNAAYFTNFVKFLLTPGRLSDSAYEETIKDLRRALQWSSLMGSEQDIASSQVLTARAIRSSMLSSRAIANSWLKVISSCQMDTDHKPIDIVFFLILYSISDEKQKQVENLMRKQIKLQILKEDLVNDAFKKFKPIFSDNLMNLITLTNTLLKSSSEHLVQTFASHMYMVMFAELTECRQIIVAELLQLVLNSRQSVLNALNILNNIAAENMSLLKGQSQKILTLFDRLDEMTLTEIRAVMNLVCGLAYSFENSDIRDDVYIIIRKELGSSIPSIKLQGILAGIHSVKYLAKGGKNDEIQMSDDVTLNMPSELPYGNLREAGEIISLIDCSTKHFPEMIAFFYDELYKILHQETSMNKNFISWLAKALTNELQENFLVESIVKNSYGEIKLSMQKCLNEESEVDDALAINIAGLILGDTKEVNVEILSPLFQLVRILHYRENDGDLSSIDALLGCPIVMPILDIDSVQDLSEPTVTRILDCIVHCVNWIRELLNAFASQTDEVLKPKILNRILHLKELEQNIEQILLRKNMTYKPPTYYSHALNICNVREHGERRPLKTHNTKQKKEKKLEPDNTTIPASSKTQPSQVVTSVKSRLASVHNIHFRPLNLTLIQLLRYNLSPPDENESELTVDIMNYLLIHLNGSLEKILVPRIKKKTFLNKDDGIYNRSEAETQAEIISKILPKTMEHVEQIVSYLDRNTVEDNRVNTESLFVSKIVESSLCLEQIYNLLTIYFKWIEFKSDSAMRVYHPLLLSSLRSIANVEDELIPIQDLIKTIMNNFEKHEKYCVTLSSAVSLIELMRTLQEHSSGSNVPPILKNMSYKFLSKQWKTPDDQLERGLIYNQGIDSLTKIYLANNNLDELKAFVIELESDAENLRDKNSVLEKMKCITKSNFSILLRNLGSALCDKIKPHLSGGLTNDEHLEMWKTVAIILKIMSNIVKVHNNKNMSSAFLRKSHPIINLFLSKGIPILKIQFKDSRQLALDVLKNFQPCTKWLQTTCKQSDGQLLMKKIPVVKGTLTDLMYKTKDILESNDCSEALGQFMEAFQVTEEVGSRGKSKKDRRSSSHTADVTAEDCDDDLPEEDSDDSIDIFQGESVGISDIL